MVTIRTYCPVEVEPTCGKVRRRPDGVPPVPEGGLRAAVRRAALHFACETHCRWCWKQMQTTVGLAMVPPKAVVARKTTARTQVGLVLDDLFPFPLLFVMLVMGALKPLQAGE